MVSTRLAGLLQIFIMTLLLGAFASCSSDAPERETTSQHGTIRLPLQASGESGNVYRLENAEFSFVSMTAPPITSVANPDAELWEVDLLVGSYDVTLVDGWQMSRLNDMGNWTPVDAILTSMNPVPATIANQAVTDLVFVFNVGREQIPFGFGRARIRIEVHETMTGFVCDIQNAAPAGGCTIADPAACICVGCVDDGACGVDDDCFCSDCLGDMFCAANCNGDGLCSTYVEGCECPDCAGSPSCPGGGSFCGDMICDPAQEDCACIDCASDPSCGGPGQVCDVVNVAPAAGCSIGDPMACVCVGCNDDGNCGVDDDCNCPDCVGIPFCGCNNDGTCTPWTESCSCGDCAGLPSCAGTGGCGDGICDMATEGCACADCVGAPGCMPGGFSCDLSPPNPFTSCSVDAAACLCVGCVDDGVCDISDDCVCPGCETEPFCADPANCINDGACQPFLEGCICPDCAEHPLCP